MNTADRMILAIDQGTTGTTVMVIDQSMSVRGRHTTEFAQHYPNPGWVEHEPEAIWSTVEEATRQALTQANVNAESIAAIGITNQRETTVIWDRANGKPIYNAIVWQCRRTTTRCQELVEAGHQDTVRNKTGLVIDPYFSGTKAAWILDHQQGARARAEAGELAFGTIDTFLLWRLTSGAVHATEPSNASRTMLLDIHETRWDEELLTLLNVPSAILPELRSSSEVYGHTQGLDFLPDGIPISGIAGDQQAALFGQACFAPGQTKSTFGTGAFVLMNTGHNAVRSDNGLLTTVAWRLPGEGTVYALEGSVFVAGAAVQWLRDGLGLIERASDIEALARSVDSSEGVMVVPAFTGLGTPYWDPEARGAILGLTRGSSRAHVARATLDGIAQQVADVLEAMTMDAGQAVIGLRVDGGAAANDLLMQTQADLINASVTRPTMLETTALGAALLAGLAVGFWKDQAEIQQRWKASAHFQASLSHKTRETQRSAWKQAVARIRSH